MGGSSFRNNSFPSVKCGTIGNNHIFCYTSSILFFCFVFYSISNKKLTSLSRSLKIEIRICASRSTTPNHLARLPIKFAKLKNYKWTTKEIEKKLKPFPRRADPTSSKAAQRREGERRRRMRYRERKREVEVERRGEESRVGTWPYAKKEKNSWICLFFFSP